MKASPSAVPGLLIVAILIQTLMLVQPAAAYTCPVDCSGMEEPSKWCENPPYNKCIFKGDSPYICKCVTNTGKVTLIGVVVIVLGAAVAVGAYKKVLQPQLAMRKAASGGGNNTDKPINAPEDAVTFIRKDGEWVDSSGQGLPKSIPLYTQNRMETVPTEFGNEMPGVSPQNNKRQNWIENGTCGYIEQEDYADVYSSQWQLSNPSGPYEYEDLRAAHYKQIRTDGDDEEEEE